VFAQPVPYLNNASCGAVLVPADAFNRQAIRACELKVIWFTVSHDGLEAVAQGYLLPAAALNAVNPPIGFTHKPVRRCSSKFSLTGEPFLRTFPPSMSNRVPRGSV
jgi:hypothetical protein